MYQSLINLKNLKKQYEKVQLNNLIKLEDQLKRY